MYIGVKMKIGNDVKKYNLIKERLGEDEYNSLKLAIMDLQSLLLSSNNEKHLSRAIIEDYLNMKYLHRSLGLYKAIRGLSALSAVITMLNVGDITSIEMLIGLLVSGGAIVGSSFAIKSVRNTYRQLRSKIVDICMNMCAGDNSARLSEKLEKLSNLLDSYNLESEEVKLIGEDACDELINNTNGY